jgi:mRNA interferase HigB
MNVIKRRTLQQFWQIHPQAQMPLLVWFKIARKARWRSFAGVRATRGDADKVRVRSGRNAVVFNIGGNKYRVITLIDYLRQRVLVTHVLTHAEYDAEKWKRDL